jgi:hypothetical protein
MQVVISEEPNTKYTARNHIKTVRVPIEAVRVPIERLSEFP